MPPLPVANAAAIAHATGNAVFLRFSVPSLDDGYDSIRVLRKTTNDISGPTDSTAVTVFDGDPEPALNPSVGYRIINPTVTQDQWRKVIDVGDPDNLLLNGTEYFYNIYVQDTLATFSTAVTVNVTPALLLAHEEVDAEDLIRLRLQDGLAARIAQGTLSVPPNVTRLDVMLSSPFFDGIRIWPIVILKLLSDDDFAHGFGQIGTTGGRNRDGTEEIRRVRYKQHMVITGFALNDVKVRNSLHRAIKSVLDSNRQLLYMTGIHNLELRGRKEEDLETYNAPMYVTTWDLEYEVSSGEVAPEQSVDIDDITVTSTFV